MDKRVKNIKNARLCEIFAKNAEERGRPDLANEARIRAVEIRAEEYGAKSEAEKEAIQAIYAYEEVLTKKNGKRTRASRTWQMIKRRGIIESVERAVNRESVAQGYTALADEYSGPNRPPIPVEAGHPFRLKAATHSGEAGHP